MKYTTTLLKTSKENPANEEARNAQLLIRGAFIAKNMAGVYAYLPLGLRVLRKIENIVREEMDRIASELFLTALCNKEYWATSGRWNSVDVLYRVPTNHGEEVALNCTHEDNITPIMKHFAQSPKDFPKYVYQIQTKFRNEPRAKSGLMRGREFLMKDAYSFDLTQESFSAFYEKMKEVYMTIYTRLGLGDRTVIAAASGGDFTKRHSHEFQTICEVGEDEIYLDEATGEYFNKEIVENPDDPKWKIFRASEVGNIFPLETRFSEAFDLKIDGKPVIMGSYGIGVSRLMGVIAEIFCDDRGLVWPKQIAPFAVYLAPIGKEDAVYKKADELYEQFQKAGIEVLHDDRRDKKTGPGQKFADHELLGIPYRVVISEKSLAENQAEVVSRKEGQTEMVSLDKLVKYFS